MPDSKCLQAQEWRHIEKDHQRRAKSPQSRSPSHASNSSEVPSPDS